MSEGRGADRDAIYPGEGRGAARRRAGERPAREPRSERPARPPLRIALRLAARNARRSLGRSILIVAMMAIPVAGMSATAVVVASSNPTDQELVDLHLGDAEGIMRVVGPPGSVIAQNPHAPINGWHDGDSGDEAADVVDPASLVDGDVIAVTDAYLSVVANDRVRQVQFTAGDVFVDELAARYELIDGVAPRSDGEIALSPALATTLGVEIGSDVTVQPGDRRHLVTGIGRTTHDARDVFRAFTTPSSIGIDDASAALPHNSLYFVMDQAFSWGDIRELNEQGIIATSRDVILGDGPFPGALQADFWSSAFGFEGQWLAIAAMAGAFLLLQVVLLAGAAFMVGARQQQRSLAILSSVGGDRRLIRSVVSAGGVVLGGVGALVGIALGIGGAALFMSLTADGRATQYPGFHLDLLSLAVVVFAAVGSGWLAAAIPARVATRIDVVSALRGARRPAVVKRGARRIAATVVVLGVATMLAGGVLLAYLRTLDEYPVIADVAAVGSIVVGAVLLQLGVVLALPMILRALARLTAGMRTAIRLATRDSSRNSARTVPVAAAVMTTVFVASFLMGIFGATQAESEAGYTPQAPMGASIVSVRMPDPATAALTPIDDIDRVAGELKSIANADDVTLVSGVYTQDFWGYDSVAGEDRRAPEGATTVVVKLDPNQVCPTLIGPAEPLDDAEWTDWYNEAQEGPGCSGDQSWSVGANPYWADEIRVGGISELEAGTGMTLGADARAALDAGGVVALRSEYVTDEHVKVAWVDSTQLVYGQVSAQALEPVRSVEVPAVVQEAPPYLTGAILMSPETAERLDLTVTPAALVAYGEGLPGQAQRDALMELSLELVGDQWGMWSVVEGGPIDIVGPAAWVLVAISAVIALAASAIALGLARIDGRRDEAILGAVGATRILRRAVSFWQAALLAGMGASVGSVLGIAAAGALALPGGPLPFSPPWLQVAIVAVGMPVLIAAGAWLVASKSRVLPTDRSAIA